MSLSRRTILVASAGLLASLSRSRAVRGAEVPNDLDIIDCHTHFYDPTRPEGVPWPGKGTALYRTVLPQHLREQTMFRRVTGTVVVEASPRLEDNAWLLDLAKRDPFVVGVVGSLDPLDANFAQHVARFAGDPLFRGIRVSVRTVNELLSSERTRLLQPLIASDCELDVNGGPDTPAAVGELAKKLPELRIVLNHIGNVRITSAAPPESWQAGIRAAAAGSNTYCKISALVEGATGPNQKAPRELDFYRPYLDVVWNAFGPDRVIYGSNWPVSERAADYVLLQQLALEYVAERGGREALEKFCAQNAKRAYKWVERPGRR